MPFFYNAFVMTPKSLLPAFLDGMTENISRRPNILYEAVVSLQLVVQTGWLERFGLSSSNHHRYHRGTLKSCFGLIPKACFAGIGQKPMGSQAGPVVQ